MTDSFEIEIKKVHENEDGSAVIQVEMCNRARELLIEAGLVSLLKKHIEEIENET